MVLRLLPWAIWCALVVFSVATYAGLPGDIPQHINAAGETTRSAGKTWFTWLLLPGVAGLTLALLSGLTLAFPKHPDLFSFPEKERLLKIPAEYRGEVIQCMQQTMDVIATLTIAVMAFVQYTLWQLAHGRPMSNALPIILISTVVFLPVALVMTSRVSRATEAAEKKWRAATGGTDSRTSDRR